MEALRTPDERFANLPDYPFEPHYWSVDGLRMHYVNEGEGPIVLCLHGEPSWSYLYRHMIPPLAAAGCRVVAPDLIGFGKSDKPPAQADYSYAKHVGWVGSLLEQLDLREITLFCQDWGGLIGLVLVARFPERFARVVVANTGLPTGDHPMPEAFMKWREFSRSSPKFDVGQILQRSTTRALTLQEVAAYDAPFPDDTFQAGARSFPSLVPISPEDPGAALAREAWTALVAFEKPFLTAFSDKDPITRGADVLFQGRVPGSKGQAHTTIAGGGHFLQEDAPAELVGVVTQLMGLV